MKDYIGSVRFYKHIFLIICAALIAVPTALISVFLVRGHYEDRLSEFEGNALVSIEDGNAVPEGEFPSYVSLYPELYSNIEPKVTVEENTAYLTFDNGPSEETTGKVLDILKANEIKATFFVAGEALEKEENAALLKRIAEEGHSIGLTSYTNDYKKIYNSVEDFLEEFYESDKKISEITGIHPSVFRFPGGSINSYNSRIFMELIGEMTRRGYVYYDWNSSAGDAALVKPSKQDIIDNVFYKIEGYKRLFVLMHDSSDKDTTVAALPDIIKKLRNDGYRFAPIIPGVKPVIFGYRN